VRLPIGADEPVNAAKQTTTADDVLRSMRQRIEFKNPLPSRARADFVREFGFTDASKSGLVTEAALRKALWRGNFGLPESHVQRLLASLPMAAQDAKSGAALYDYAQLYDRLVAAPPASTQAPKSPPPPPYVAVCL
jgi:hypothetical protein